MARIEELERMEELENGNTSKNNTQENEDTVVHDGDGGNKAGDEDEDIEVGHSFLTSDHKYKVIETKQKPKDPLQKASNQKVLSSFISHQTGNISKQQLKEEALSNSNMQFPVEAHSFSNKELSVGKEKAASSPLDAQLSVSKIEDSPHETTSQTLNPVSSGRKAFTGSIVERDLGPQPIQSSKSTNLSQAFTGSIVEHNIGPQPIQSSKNTNLSQSSAPSSTKPVSRFKMQKGNR
ncbi:uncharacterized protein LOC141813982 isoform X1 [Curcuma longa]|uniref:uncharacterized protein LOC141813982 isoform X1 n=1 Tax=Curcuma longa TaxID=136217 RepID=UPI003D9EAAAD